MKKKKNWNKKYSITQVLNFKIKKPPNRKKFKMNKKECDRKGKNFMLNKQTLEKKKFYPLIKICLLMRKKWEMLNL